MNEPTDVWYVRLPDGKVLRAGSTNAVRHHLETGRIPLDSRVRRRPHDDWMALHRAEAFADLVKPRFNRTGNSISAGQRESYPFLDLTAKEGAPSQRRDVLRLQTVGVRGLVEELLTALDSALGRGKLLIAALVGLTGGLVFLLQRVIPMAADFALLSWLAGGLAVLIVAGLAAAALAQMTFVELTRLRSAFRGEVKNGLGRNALRIIIAQLLLVGGALAAVLGLRELAIWLVGEVTNDILAAVAIVIRLGLEVLLWPVLPLALLVAPIVVIEECSFAQALRDWLRLLRQHHARVFVYEALAVALGSIATLPLLAPVAVAAWTSPAELTEGIVAHAALDVLLGAAAAPLISYLFVANMFIYLNLRYEHR